jgi:mannose-6-phosphate isomerase
MPETQPYPLTFEPILMPKVWGGRRLRRYAKPMPPVASIGESWEIADLEATSASGGGGGAALSVVANGAMTGLTLHDVIERWGTLLLGERLLTSERLKQERGMPAFPLLVKYLDAREHLSVQVHPSPEYADTNADAHLKTESWYIVEADEGSVIFKGLREGVTPADLKGAIEAGTVPNLLRAVPAVVGECHTLPSGTVHALGAGVLVAEVQTPSDTTFRLYDWTNEYDRPERELHIEQALECADFGPPIRAGVLDPETDRGVVAETPFYRLIEARLAGSKEPINIHDAPVVAMCIAGDGRVLIEDPDGRFETVELTRGQTALVPAAISGYATVRGVEGDMVLLLAEALPG